VRLIPGSGNVTVNDRTIADYLKRDSLVRIALFPLVLTNNAEKYDVVARVMGGGLTGQAGAIRMGVARALLRLDETLKAQLGKEGLLTRDSRMKERKKYGQPGARKRFQFSKR
jgi:small subunit ribosomal protein S9